MRRIVCSAYLGRLPPQNLVDASGNCQLLNLFFRDNVLGQVYVEVVDAPKCRVLKRLAAMLVRHNGTLLGGRGRHYAPRTLENNCLPTCNSPSQLWSAPRVEGIPQLVPKGGRVTYPDTPACH